MTRNALRGQRLKLAGRGAFVAGIAIHRCMRPGEREPIVVLLNLLYGYLPSSHGVTLFTVCSQLAFVNVRVAILAALTNIGENRLDVALRASH